MSGTTSQSALRVAVLGQGYVGLPVAIRAVEAGYDVVGYDVDKRKIDGLKGGSTHIDDVSDADVAAALATGRYLPTAADADLHGFDIAVITVPTPLREGAPDLSFIEASIRTVGAHLRTGSTVILESTTYPGTTDGFVLPILEDASGLTGGRDFKLGFSPERIDPGNRTWTFERTPKIVSGIDAESLAAVRAFYDDLVDVTVATKGTREAELAKLLENTFRHVNIALVNEIAVNARALDIDIRDVIAAASSKPFGFMPFHPGPGVGGHCLPIDPSYLSWQFERELGTVSQFVKIANQINDGMPGEVVRRIQIGLNDRLKPVRNSRILIVGIAYKKNSNDSRETPATKIVEGLLRLGADVHLHDPHVDRYELDDRTTRVELDADEVAAADAVVIVTDHDEVDYDLILDNADYVFDARFRVHGANVEHL